MQYHSMLAELCDVVQIFVQVRRVEGFRFYKVTKL